MTRLGRTRRELRQTECGQRRREAVGAFPEHKIEALVVSSPANVRYLSGYTGSNGLLLLLPDRAELFTDPRYRIQAAEETDCAVRVERGPLIPAVARRLRAESLRRIGFEKAHLSYDSYAALDELLPGRSRLVPRARLVETLRMVKSADEIERIRRSVLLNSEAYAQTLPLVRPGVSELELAAELEYRMRRLGAEQPAFESIVAFGPRSALPHARPTANILTANGLLLMDAGAVRDGYASDMTRMAFVGRPTKRVRQLYRSVLDAQLAACAAVKEGVTAGAIDRTARSVLRKHRLDGAFVHSIGHGLGLEIHEMPRLGRRDATRLRAGMAITIEPGVYLQEFGGIRIEDTVVVTRTGCEVLTPTSKELVII